MIRFKDWATAKGAIDWLWVKNQPRRHLRYGACLPNGPGDDDHLADISGECARVPDHQAVQYSYHGKHNFYIATIGRKDESHEEIALQIGQIESVCNQDRLPVYWLVWNEEHERHEADVHKVRKAYVDLFPSRFPRAKFIVKAAYKSCVEGSGLEMYERLFKQSQPLDPVHFLHYYLKPSWENGACFENWKRRSRLVYIVGELRKRGVKEIYVDEFHASGRERAGFASQGDWVYCDRSGYIECLDLFMRLELSGAFYYQCPFNNYLGNDLHRNNGGFRIGDMFNV